MSEQEGPDLEGVAAIDVHDLEALKKLWFMFREAKESSEVFTLAHLLLHSLPYDWVDTNDNWLHIAQQLEEHGEQELASLFKLANQKAFALMFHGK